MQLDKALKAAEHILEDRRGADYYQDNTVLSDYLANALSFTAEEAKRVAQAIQEVLKGIAICGNGTYCQEQIIKASKLGFRIGEVAVRNRRRMFGTSRQTRNVPKYLILFVLNMCKLLLGTFEGSARNEGQCEI